MAKQKPLSNVERQRKFRANVKASEEKHQRYLAAEKKRWQKRKEAGKIKCVATMPKRELRAKRRDWAKIKRTQRQKKKDAETLNLVLEQCVTNLPSPPRTPQINIDPLSEQGSRQSIQGRKKIRRDRSKSYREIQRLRTENEKLRKEAQKFKKRNQRLLSTNRLMCNNTPRSKTKKMLIGCRVTAEVRRSLLFHNVTVEVMKNKYAEKKQKNKKIIRDIFLDRLLIKYKLKKDIRKNIGIRYRSSNMTAGQNERRGLAVKCVENVRDFLQRDSNSRITTGKRDTITQKSDKRQRRVLLDSLRNLHIKYCAENSEQKMSFSLFCKIKPFHVRKATGRDRDTCLCRIHENGQLMLDRLHQIKLISAGPDNVDKCVECICCPGGKEDCYSRQCEICKNNVIVNSEDDTMVWWWEWDYVINNVMVRGEMKCVRKMVKMRREGNVMELCNRFQEHLSSRLCPHIWRIWRQRSALKKLREEGGVNRIIMIIDFSENYNAKYARETQATHFGASQVQITLHTGVAYINNKPVSFCSVSPSYEHNPSAIWAHLMPVLQQLKDEHPNVCSLDIWSDGPTTQYRNKQNFWLLSHIAPRYFSDVTWNMFEAGHGKGPADAVGGVVKRMADDKVLRGADIPDAKALFDTLTTSSAVRIFYVDESAIRTVSKMIPKNLTAVKGTMNLHQITLTNTVGLIAVRNVSCFCNLPSRVMCSCYQPREVQLPVVSRFVASSSVSLPDVPIILEQTKLTRTAVKKACATKVSTIIDLQAKSIRIRKPTEKAATITKQQAMLIRSRASTKKCVSRIDTNVRQQLKPTRTRTTSSPGVVIRKPAYLMPSFTPLLKRATDKSGLTVQEPESDEIIDKHQTVPTVEKPQSNVTVVQSDTSSNQIQSDSAVDQVQSDSAVDQVQSDSAVDQVQSDSAVDQVQSDSAVVQLQLDVTIDQVQLDSTVEQLGSDAPVDQSDKIIGLHQSNESLEKVVFNETFRQIQPMQTAIELGDFVIVDYCGELYPGKVLAVAESSATVTVMYKCGVNYKWPKPADVLPYDMANIKLKISAPLELPRNMYFVPEMGTN